MPLLIAAFSVRTPQPLPPPSLPAAFDSDSALALTGELVRLHPNRRPGTPGATAAAGWLRDQLASLRFRPESDRFEADVPGLGRVWLENVYAIAPGQSPEAIVLMAHRDGTGAGPGANDNASGTAALVELARSYASPQGICLGEAPQQSSCPARSIIFLSTDAGAFGGVGADHFAETSPYRDRIVAVVNLDAIAGPGPPRIQFAGDAPRTPGPTFLRTLAARIAEQTGQLPERPSALRQLVDLGFPFSLYEQAPFVSRGIPAMTLSTAPDRPGASVSDTGDDLSRPRLAQVGNSAQALLGSLDQGLELRAETRSHVFLGARVVPGWAVQIVLLGALVPFLFVAVDLFARCRRRRIRLAPAWRSLRSRLGFWAWAGLLFGLLGLLGAWPDGVNRPLAPESSAAGDWPVLWLGGLALLAGLGWLVARERLLPRRPATAEEELAGHTVALLALAVVALLTVATNVFALLFLLPSLHAWLWLVQLRDRPFWTRAAVLGAGLAGPLLLIGSFAGRFGLGFDAPWYMAALVAVGYVPLPLVLVLGAWLAAGGQLAALVAGRYAPYPGARERPPRGPIRNVVRRLLLAHRTGRTKQSEPEELETIG